MLVGIHCNAYGEYDDYLKRYEDIMDLNDIAHIRLNASDNNFWAQVRSVDIFIYRWGHVDHYYDSATTILPIIEKEMGIKCYPNQATCWHYDDKIKQYYLLKEHNYPVVSSYIFWNEKKALKWLETAELPLVFKLKGGAGSSSVILVKTKAYAVSLIKRMFGKGMIVSRVPAKGALHSIYKDPIFYFKSLAVRMKRLMKGEDQHDWWRIHKNYVYFQKFCADNKWDTRVATIGKKAYAFRRFVRKNDFRASGSNLWDLDPSQVDLRFVEIAHEISQHFGFQSMAYDFVYDENKNPALIEISYTWGEPDYPEFNDGYWDTNMVWHGGHFRSRELIMSDLLGMPDLKVPEIQKHNYAHIKIREK